ncbi:unnamed protein product, partial [Prunus brigantina]
LFGSGGLRPRLAEHLLVDGLDGVARVWVDVGRAVAEEELGGVRVGGGNEGLHPPQHVVEGAVLLHQNDHRFDGAAAAAAA